jgi:hypothetical protein
MKTIAIIFNGIHLPYHVVHYAIDKAKAEQAEIFALFLRCKHESSKGYRFLSDMATTETKYAEKEAATQDEMLLSDNMDSIQQMVSNEKIPYHSDLRIAASVGEIAALTADADLVIVDAGFGENALMCDEKISLKVIKEKLNKPVDVIADE